MNNNELIRTNNKRQWIRTILPSVMILLACLLGWWISMELRHSGEMIYTASTNGEKILKEMPDLALTDGELALAEVLMNIPEIQEAVSSDTEKITVLEASTTTPLLTSYLPENGRIIEVAVIGPSIHVCFTAGNRYTILEYGDADLSGTIDHIHKTYAVSPLDEIGADGRLGDVDVVYELSRSVESGVTQYKKYKTRHMWFSFLDRN